MKNETLRDGSGKSPRMLLNVERVANWTQGQRHLNFVPEGHLRIARRFNAGLAGDEAQVPQGRLTGTQYELLPPPLFQPRSDFLRIARSVEHGDDVDYPWFYRIINAVRKSPER